MSSRNDTIRVEVSRPSDRLDSFLQTQFPAVSRGALRRLIDEGHIRIDGRQVKPSHHPHAGETIEVYWPEPRAAEAHPEDIPLDILYEDDDLVVLNKPPGLVVHPAAGHEEHTLVNALLHHCEGELSGIGGVARPGIVHRLDKDTSGCLVAAKNDAAHIALAEQFEGRSLEKVYNAIVCGVVPRDAGSIRVAIARHPNHRQRMAATDGTGREAHTDYRVMERLSHATLAEATLHTGRTHQIRVHFLHLGHPVVGDATYGKRQNQRLAELSGYQAPRQMLHARRLGFQHPRQKKKLTFEAPWPEDFKAALAALRSPAEKSANS